MKRVPFLSLAVLLAFIIFWFFPLLRSVSVMSIYSAVHERDSIMSQEGFSLRIPGGNSTVKRDWYPFPMTFNAGWFTNDARMSIIYNFPAFDPLTRSSSIFDENSEYNSAFYGAYIIEKKDGSPYGFSEGRINTEEIAEAFEYDYVNLVLESFKNMDFIFTPVQYETSATDYLGYDDWLLVDAIINTNGTAHRADGFKRSYIQYGSPGHKATEDFPLILMHGRLYLRYFKEYNCTVAMYIMARSEEVIIDCDENILSKSMIIEK